MKIFNWISNRKTKDSVSSTTPEIGVDIKWTEIVGHVFRILDFDRNGTIIDENGKVIAKSKFKPYGYLLVESPILNQSVKLPIVHRDEMILFYWKMLRKMNYW